MAQQRRRGAVLGLRRRDHAAGAGAATWPAAYCFWFTDIGVKQIHISPRRELHRRRARRQVDPGPAQHRCGAAAGDRLRVDHGGHLRPGLPRHALPSGFDWLRVLRAWAATTACRRRRSGPRSICGVPAYTIKALARYWAKHAVSIAHCNGGSFIRSCLRARARAPRSGAPGHAGTGQAGRATSSSSSSGRSSAWTSRDARAAVRVEIHRTAASALPRPATASRSAEEPHPRRRMIPEAIMNPPVCSGTAHIVRRTARARTSSTGPTRSRSRATSACT